MGRFIPVPTGRLVLLMLGASIVVALLPLPVVGALLATNGLILLAFLIDAVLATSPTKVKLHREMPEIITMGESADVNWTLTNESNKGVYLSFADAFPPSFDAERRSVSLRIPAQNSRYATTTIAPKRRGRFELSTYTARVYGPLGLAARQGRNTVLDVLRVYPSFKSRKEAELRIERGRILDVGLRSVRAHGGGTEFEQLREYNLDDDFRRIDWAATARSLKTIVRTYRAERNQNVSIMLDTGRTMAGRVDEVPRLEMAMDAVMALSTVALRLGDRVGLVAFDAAVQAEVASSQGASHVARITEAMYRLEPNLVESDYRGAFLHSLSRNKKRSLVVLLTELSAYGIKETLLPALPLMLRRHEVIIASVADPDVAIWSSAIPVEANKAFRKAAAIESQQQRRATVSQLRGLGATVIDAVPSKLAAAVADAYLDMKATGRL